MQLGELRFRIPDDLHKKLKEKALKQDKTLKELVIDLLTRGVRDA
jgi:predicted HicB family RNase H-like nuclease